MSTDLCALASSGVVTTAQRKEGEREGKAQQEGRGVGRSLQGINSCEPWYAEGIFLVHGKLMDIPASG